MPPQDFVILRQGTLAEWAAKTPSPVLKLGEVGVETDTHRMKIGDGVTAWSALGYIAGTFDLENVPVQVARDTTANLTALTDPFLSGQIVYDQTTGKTVIGDGESLFDELPDIRDQFQTIVTVRKTGKGKFSCANPAYSSDAECIQAALDHISSLGGGVLHIEKGHYICNSRLLYTGSNLIFEGHGENTILDFSGITDGSIEANWCIYIHGSITSTNSLLAADAATSGITITVADGTKFQTGDWIRIRSNAVFIEWTQHLGEIQQIKSISGNILTLNETLFSGYLITDTATVDKVTMLENIHIKNLKIVATNTNNNFGIVCAQSHNVKIENVTSEDMEDRSIQFTDVVSGKVHNCLLKRSNRAGLGYGIAIINSSRDILATNNTFYDCRHGISCGGDGTYGIQYNQIWGYNTQNYDSQNIGMFGPHATCDGLLIIGNTCNGSGLGFLNGMNNIALGNIIRNATSTYGIGIATNCKNAYILNNDISTVSGRGINITNYFGDIYIHNNSIDSNTHGIYSEVNNINISIKNNVINASGNGIYLRTNGSTVQSTGLTIKDNQITSDVTGIQIQSFTNNLTDVNIKLNDIKCGATGACIQVWGGDEVSEISDCNIINNTCLDGVYGITISSVTGSYIDNNNINDSTTGIHIAKNRTPVTDDYTIIQNKIHGCTTPINDVANGTIKRITNNDGYKTENTGTATIPVSQTSVTVSHGLVSAPTRVNVTPFGNVGSCWVDPASITATEMTIHCSTAPETDTVVSWSAQVV